jgi:membrane-associated HD superfamily phosphohydrolase
MRGWKVKVLSSSIALSVLIPTFSFAATDIPEPLAHHQKFDQEKHQQMQAQLLDSVTKYTPADLTEWKAALAEREKLKKELREKYRPKLSDEQKTKVKDIHEDLISGKITQEQAEEQLKQLGIDRPERWKMSPEVSEKLQAIRENVKSGTITEEQAREEIKKLCCQDKPKNSLWMQYREALKTNDETKIKEILPQMLQQLQERNKVLAKKLADNNK